MKGIFCGNKKMATPDKSIFAPVILSGSLLGCESPKPTVDSDENVKYTAVIVCLKVCWNSQIILFCSQFGSKGGKGKKSLTHGIFLPH